MTKSISYPIAKTLDGQWVHIDIAKHGNNYYCPECESPFVARLGSIKIHHFAHKPNYTGVCTGESGYHSLAKHLLAYHYEKEGQIPLISKCTTCGRNYSGLKKVIKVEVEKGQDDYRPDIRLLLEGEITIDCEVVYKNPLGDKLNIYKERKPNLLIWSIRGQVDKVPPLIQYSWPEIQQDKYLLNEKGETDKLLLLASSPPPKHVCSPYGIAYVVKVDCYKCHRETKVAILSSWYPIWGESAHPGGTMGFGNNDISYHDNLPYNSVPSLFWGQLNKVYGTKLFEDDSYTTHRKYLMNHCTLCGEKFGDFYLLEMIRQKMLKNKEIFSINKVEISFTLTEWEKGKVIEST